MGAYLERMREKAHGMSEAVVLALESSCDETAVAVVRGKRVLSSVIASQVEEHARYGGVVPEIASRLHVEAMDALILKALDEAKMSFGDIQAVAATKGPGLVGALLCAVSHAKALAFSLDVPLIGVNHILAHVWANYIDNPDLKPPFVCLVASGGHSHILSVGQDGYRVLAKTRDDAAGEALDKAARVLGLGYPGGPNLERAAKGGDAEAFKFPKVAVRGEGYDMSFSGLKTALINHVHNLNQRGGSVNVPDLAASFQSAVVSELVWRVARAAREVGAKTVLLAGGVSANSLLRREMKTAVESVGAVLLVPRPEYCTDNAAMVGVLGHEMLLRGELSGLDMNAEPGLSV